MREDKKYFLFQILKSIFMESPYYGSVGKGKGKNILFLVQAGPPAQIVLAIRQTITRNVPAYAIKVGQA